MHHANAPRRLPLQYSLKWLLIWVAIISVPLAWFGIKLRQKRIERAAVEELEKAGVAVRYHNWQPARAAEPPGPAWTRKLLGDDVWTYVAGIEGDGFGRRGKLTDASMAHVAALTSLQWVDLSSSTEVSDAGLAYLKGLGELRTLVMSDTKVGAAGLAHLAELVKLQRLSLNHDPGVTDAGLVHLRRLSQLQMLRLNGTGVTDAGLVNLRGFSELQMLELNGNKISGAGLAHLEGLAKLKELCLENTELTDDGLSHLRGLTQLELLVVSGTKVTDAGLPYLRGLKSLRMLDLEDTEVTDTGVAQLEQALPNCEIIQFDYR